ncbi:MAG: Fmu (Sun) domain-containing protein [Alistipes sp. 58_9_plus]|nr:MAG: Fmu (Sun) domain-containing protein [Alistipes sp. 58_9_plus]
MVDTVAGAYALTDAELMIEGFGAAAARPVTLRANTLKATAEDIAAALDAAGIAHQTVTWYPDAFILPEAQVSDLWDLDIYRDGKIYLQSLSSMMPPLVLDAQAGEDILDMCAAPGGKTTQIAALTQGQAHLTACEMSIPRAEKLEANLHRQGAKNVPVMRIDARELDEFFRFDRIQKSLRGLTEQLLSKCARSQRALLDRAMGALKPGGTLVYSTCSILPQENEDALQEALDKHMDCELIPLDGTPSESEARRAQDAGEEPHIESNALTEAIAAGQVSAIANGLPGTLTIPPSRDFEGFYIALIRKRS